MNDGNRLQICCEIRYAVDRLPEYDELKLLLLKIIVPAIADLYYNISINTAKYINGGDKNGDNR